MRGTCGTCQQKFADKLHPYFVDVHRHFRRHCLIGSVVWYDTDRRRKLIPLVYILIGIQGAYKICISNYLRLDPVVLFGLRCYQILVKFVSTFELVLFVTEEYPRSYFKIRFVLSSRPVENLSLTTIKKLFPDSYLIALQ